MLNIYPVKRKRIFGPSSYQTDKPSTELALGPFSQVGPQGMFTEQLAQVRVSWPKPAQGAVFSDEPVAGFRAWTTTVTSACVGRRLHASMPNASTQ